MKRDRFKQIVAIAAIHPPKGKPKGPLSHYHDLTPEGDRQFVVHHPSSYAVEPRCIAKGVPTRKMHRGMIRALATKMIIRKCDLCFDWKQWNQLIAQPRKYKVPKQKKAPEPEPEPTARKKVVERPYGATTLGDYI